MQTLSNIYEQENDEMFMYMVKLTDTISETSWTILIKKGKVNLYVRKLNNFTVQSQYVEL